MKHSESIPSMDMFGRRAICTTFIHGLLLFVLFLVLWFLVPIYGDMFGGSSPSHFRPFSRVMAVWSFFSPLGLFLIPIMAVLLALDAKFFATAWQQFGEVRARTVSRSVTIVLVLLLTYCVWAMNEPLWRFWYLNKFLL